VAQKKFLSLPALETTLEAFVEGDELEWDEIWSFVKRRKNKRWIWLALCRRTRQVVALAIGNRGKKTCLLLWKAIPEAYKKAHCFADIWEAYSKVIAASQLSNSPRATPKRAPTTSSASTALCARGWAASCEKLSPFPKLTTCT
jgi:IS1 family transposase